MGKVLDYIKGILADGSGAPSSKRIISVIFAILIGAAFVANLGITGIEKIAPRKQQNEVE